MTVLRHPTQNAIANTEPRAPLTRAFLPVHKLALGLAVGTVFGAIVFAVTVFHVVLRPSGGLPLILLAQYFSGYEVSWTGALIGLFWGFVSGFVAGWFTAFVRNLATAMTVFNLRTKAELAHTRDFLDHI